MLKKIYMRTNLLILVVFSGILLLQTSCTIEKRLYRPGFFVENNSTKKKKETNSLIVNVKNEKSGELDLQFTQDNKLIFHQEALKTTFNEEKLQTALALNENFPKSSQVHNTQLAYKSEIIKKIKENQKDFPLLLANKPNSKGKNQIVALLLCFFLGALGIHSFYLGNNTKGIIQLAMFLVGLLTSFFFIGYIILIALSIWVLVDFIRIIIGDLGPGW